jgi:hypothetical protein
MIRLWISGHWYKCNSLVTVAPHTHIPLWCGQGLLCFLSSFTLTSVYFREVLHVVVYL